MSEGNRSSTQWSDAPGVEPTATEGVLAHLAIDIALAVGSAEAFVEGLSIDDPNRAAAIADTATLRATFGALSAAIARSSGALPQVVEELLFKDPSVAPPSSVPCAYSHVARTDLSEANSVASVHQPDPIASPKSEVKWGREDEVDAGLIAAGREILVERFGDVGLCATDFNVIVLSGRAFLVLTRPEALLASDGLAIGCSYDSITSRENSSFFRIAKSEMAAFGGDRDFNLLSNMSLSAYRSIISQRPDGIADFDTKDAKTLTLITDPMANPSSGSSAKQVYVFGMDGHGAANPPMKVSSSFEDPKFGVRPVLQIARL